MSTVTENKIVVALDIGTSQVTVLAAEVLPDGELNLIGFASQASRGMDKGGVNDLDSVTRSVRLAISEASDMIDSKINSVYLSISGHHISCQNERGMVSIDGSEVSQYDVDHVIHMAQSVKIPTERAILHVLPQEYTIDEVEGIRSPTGMSGVRMEAEVHIVTGASDWARNIKKCVERENIRVNDLVFSGIASAEAVLTEDEKELGVCVVDIGAGTTDITIYTGGALRHCQVLPIAGNQVTSDIAKLFRTPISHAEQIKVQYACAQSGLVSMEQRIDVPSVGGRPSRHMSRHTLAEVVEPRYQEFFEMIAEVLRNSGFENQIAAGIVLTGGTSQIEGAEVAAEACFGMQVRLAQPRTVRGLNEYIRGARYATAVGLLHHGAQRLLEQEQAARTEHKFASKFSQAIAWIKEQF